MQRLSLDTKQQLGLSPQQIQLVKLLELPVQDLDKRVNEELEANPALEEDHEAQRDNEILEPVSGETLSLDDDDIPAYKLRVNNDADKGSLQTVVRDNSADLHSHLLQQLGLKELDSKQLQLASYLVRSMDDDGYIRRDLALIANDIAFGENIDVSSADLEQALLHVQSLEPAGVGARNLQECLLLQVQRKLDIHHTVPLANAQLLLRDHFEDFGHKRYDKIMHIYNWQSQDLKEVVAQILKLNPKPGGNVGEGQTDALPSVFPDFIVEYNDGELLLSLASRNIPALKVSEAYVDMLREYRKNQTEEAKAATAFARQKIDNAKWFIEALQQRHNTLMAIMTCIMHYQREFFISGEETKIKPLVMKTIASESGYDLSTISRVANSKYVQTSFGIFPLKFFFSEKLGTDSGEDVSTREIKTILMTLIEEEDKSAPLSDEDLMEQLRKKGYQIARRTVAKYRIEQNIPVARLRKEL